MVVMHYIHKGNYDYYYYYYILSVSVWQDLSSMFLRDSQTVLSAFAGSMSASAVATLRRKRRHSTAPTAKKMFEEAQMTRRVRAYLNNMDIIEDENKLSEMSLQCETSNSGKGGKEF